MDEDLKIGDVVVLKSGSPKMVVTAMDSTTYKLTSVWVSWVDGVHVQSRSFPKACLKKVEE